MELKDLQKNWNKFGRQDPLYAILLEEDKKGNKWKPEEFFKRGRQEIDYIMGYTTKTLGLTVRWNRALDFGCGVGRLTQALASYFDEVIGIDIAPAMLRGARKYNQVGKRCKYLLNERADLQCLENNSFDFIYSNIVLHHMRPDYCKSYLKEFLRVLAPGGFLVFYMPSELLKKWTPPPTPQLPPTELVPRIKSFLKDIAPKPVLNAYIKFRYESQPVMEMYCVKREEIEACLRDAGGDIVDAFPDNATIPNTVGFRYTVTKH
jgi:ubiquinone/menaquinone biosynthesis C-methylase UbiE